MKFVCPEGNRAFRLFQCCNEQLSALNLRLPHEASAPNQRLACERTDPAEGGASSDCLTYSAGGTVGRPASLASLATVVARMALLLKFKLPRGAIQNAAATIKNPGGKAGG